MWRLLLEFVLFVVVAVPVVAAVVSLFKQTVVAWWNGQKAFPHSRDPGVIARDQIAKDREAALIREERAEADFDIAMKDARTRKREVLTNKRLELIHSGAIEDEVMKLALQRAEKLEARAADIRSGKIDIDDLRDEPVPDLGDGSDCDRERDDRKRVR